MSQKNKIIKFTFLILLLLPKLALAQNSGTTAASNTNNLPSFNAQAPASPDGAEKHPDFSLSKIVESIVGNKQEDKPNNAPAKSDPSKSKESSLMYSDEETKKIKEAFEAFKNNIPLTLSNNEVVVEEKKPTQEDNAKSYIYLGSILYQSRNNWSVWINDKKISSDNNKVTNDLYIRRIDGDSVDIVWIMSISKWKILSGKKSESEAPINANNQVELNFTLSFNQTYVLNSNKVVEGRIIPSAIKESSTIGNIINQILNK